MKTLSRLYYAVTSQTTPKHCSFSETEVNALCKSCQVGRQVGLHLGHRTTRERRTTRSRGRKGGSPRGQGPKGGSTHGVAEAEAEGLPQPYQHRPVGGPRRWQRRDAGSEPEAEAEAATSVRAESQRLPVLPGGPDEMPRRVGRSQPQEAPAERPPSPRATFGLAVGAVLVVLLPQQFGQDELVLLVQLLSLLPTRACRHVGMLAAGRQAQTRASRRVDGQTALARPGGRGYLAPLGPRADWAQEAAAAAVAAGTGGEAAVADPAPTCSASSPSRRTLPNFVLSCKNSDTSFCKSVLSHAMEETGP